MSSSTRNHYIFFFTADEINHFSYTIFSRALNHLSCQNMLRIFYSIKSALLIKKKPAQVPPQVKTLSKPIEQPNKQPVP